ncbi:MAG: hypothetical protein ACE5JS_12240 [Nitrospinota bacterium]
MRTSSFLGIHHDGTSFRSVLLRKRGRSRYRFACSESGSPSSFPGVPWGTALPADRLSVKIFPLSEGADSGRERELENIEVRREPQGEGRSVGVITVSAQSKDVKDFARPSEDGEIPVRIDAEPLALWAARLVLDAVPEGPFFLLAKFPGRWLLLHASEGALRFAGYLPCRGEKLSPEDAKKIHWELVRISRVMGCGEKLMDLPVELFGRNDEGLRTMEEVLTAEGWNHVRHLRPSRGFHRQFKGESGLPMTHLIALGIALRGLEGTQGRPLLNFSETADSPVRPPWYKSLRLAAGFLLLCLLAFVLSLEQSVRSLEEEAARLTTGLSHSMKILEPSARGAVPRKELAAKVAKYQEEVGRLQSVRYPGLTAVELLVTLSGAFSEVESFKLQELTLDGETIHLRGSLGTLERVNAFQDRLEKLPPIRSVSLLSAQSKKDRVEARFRLLGPPWHGDNRRR